MDSRFEPWMPSSAYQIQIRCRKSFVGQKIRRSCGRRRAWHRWRLPKRASNRRPTGSDPSVCWRSTRRVQSDDPQFPGFRCSRGWKSNRKFLDSSFRFSSRLFRFKPSCDWVFIRSRDLGLGPTGRYVSERERKKPFLTFWRNIPKNRLGGKMGTPGGSGLTKILDARNARVTSLRMSNACNFFDSSFSRKHWTMVCDIFHLGTRVKSHRLS